MSTNNNIGKPERASQNRVIQLFHSELGYSYLGDWEEEVRTLGICCIHILSFLKIKTICFFALNIINKLFLKEKNSYIINIILKNNSLFRKSN